MKRIYCVLLSTLVSPVFPNTQNRDRDHAKMLSLYSSKTRAAPKKEKEYLFRDLLGWRRSLASKGISITAGYLQYVLGNPVGEKRGVVHTEQFATDFNWKLGEVTNAQGLEFHMGAVLVSGKNLETKTGSAFPLTLLYGGRTFLVGNIYLKQTAYNDRLVFKVGRIMAGDDFLTSPLHLKFLSLAFDSQIALYANTPASGYPYATWGAYCSLTPSASTRLNIGVYSADEKVYRNKYHGLNLSFNAHSGAELIAELSYLVNQSKKHQGLKGTYKTGTFYFTGSHDRFSEGTKNGNYGTYLSIDQMLYRSRKQSCLDRHFSSFLTLLFFPKDRNTYEFYTTGGMVYQGLFRARPNDTTAIAVARGSYSSVLRELQRSAQRRGLSGAYGNKPQTYEMLFELNHWFQIRPWFNLTPAIQYVVNPRGAVTQGALILSLQSSLDF